MPFVDISRQLTANCFMCMDRKILIVDDEVDIREILQFNLENAGFNVECAASAEDALEMLTPDFALILLDVMMHGMSGFEMAQVLRQEKNNQTPIIFLTAKDTQDDLLTGFCSLQIRSLQTHHRLCTRRSRSKTDRMGNK